MPKIVTDVHEDFVETVSGKTRRELTKIIDSLGIIIPASNEVKMTGFDKLDEILQARYVSRCYEYDRNRINPCGEIFLPRPVKSPPVNWKKEGF